MIGRLRQAVGRRLRAALGPRRWAVHADRPHPSTRDWAAGAEGARFVEVHPAEEVTVALPADDFGGNDGLAGREREFFPPSFLAVIPGGRIWQEPFRFNFVVAGDGRPLRELTFRTFDYGPMAAGAGPPPPPTPLEGTTLDLTCLGDGANHSHWLKDCLPKLAWLAKLPADVRPDRVLINRRTDVAAETLARQGWEAERVVALADLGPHLRCERLVATSPITSAFQPRRVLDDIRRLVGWEPGTGHRRLYLSRRVTNEAGVLALLEPLGFEAVTLAGRTLDEQMRLMASADWVTGPHGAGFVNTMFCRPGTHFLEFLPAGYRNFHFWATSMTLGIDYARLPVTPTSDDPKKSDFAVDPARLREALERMGL